MDLLKVFRSFGRQKQMKKLAEENFELIEALVENDDLEHILEEIADNVHIIMQFCAYYGISWQDVMEEVEKKNVRTIERIGHQYY